MHVSIAAEKLFSVWGLDITNAVFTGFIIVSLLIVGCVFFNRKLSYLKPTNFQLFFEMAIGFLSEMIYDLLGRARGKNVIGFIFTFFFLILFSNWFGLLPFVPTFVIDQDHNSSEAVIASATKEIETYKVEEKQPTIGGCFKERNCYLTTGGVKILEHTKHVLRAPTTDLSLTVGLAIIAVISTNFAGFAVLKLGYLKKFFNFSNPIDAIVGILEFLSEFIRIISFSFRLFGNIFAGELLLIIMTSLTYGLATLPFLFFEVFVGLIQAFVFFILLGIFISLAVQDHSQTH
jgi:F-type H+-transporting ATPase subunit a